ncbi:TELO2-interacting protein 1 homolog [Stomoxys calcitrans]|uniref:TELO2-interacting protein 1 homolog n=1 Tax=Stomoxys calcitrans TaxID=35570 RepID=A0A1I8Q7I8_STOCA|nr:TELO2-interacting protein 1 homolog [Stomoxys calcitrans]
MSSLEPFVNSIKPAMDSFLRQPNKETLSKLENELVQFNWTQMNIFNVHILIPLVLKLDELSDDNNELRSGCLECITLVTSKVYLKELTALRTMMVVTLKQIRDCEKASMRPNISEELKLASVKCIAESLRRCTTDVLEQFYCHNSSTILGQILLTLVDLIEYEKYKKIINASLECLMIVFYVHEEADKMDVVLRNQVADVLFIFLPKIVTILCRTAIADEKKGESSKINSIKALGSILCVIYEESMENDTGAKYDVESFKKLFSVGQHNINCSVDDVLGLKKNRGQLETRMKQLQNEGRSEKWMQASSKKLRVLFNETNILRCHVSKKIRQEYAQMCCLLIQNCAQNNLKENFIFLLENVVAFTEDEDIHIRNLCRDCIDRMQNVYSTLNVFDEISELLFDEHLAKLPRIIQRGDDAEQLAELMFLKGFLKSMSPTRLQLLLSIPKNLDIFCMCLLLALELEISMNLLLDEYSLRDIDVESDYMEASKLHWRRFKNLSSEKSVYCLKDVICILGRTPILNRLITNHLMEMLQMQNSAINEILLAILWLSTAKERDVNDLGLVRIFVEALLEDEHWNLSLEADKITKLKTNRHTDWFVDRTPGLYESAVEVRTQDYDSDDETEGANDNVTIADAEFNVLHTCIVMDCLGHCALYIGERFDGYLFQALHKVLLKLAHSYVFVYQAAIFALVAIQRALRFSTVYQLIEVNTDYVTYHLNTLLRKSSGSKSAVDIFTVILQFSSPNTFPHMESIFETIFDECSKACQAQSIVSYLKVFMAFLGHIKKWLHSCHQQFHDTAPLERGIAITALKSTNTADSWLKLLEDTEQTILLNTDIETAEDFTEQSNFTADTEHDDKLLPRYIEVVKTILYQVVKFINSSDQDLQILSLECVSSGLPLLSDYENELLPLVHLIWSPFVEKFRQRNACVLNRCFTLLEVLAKCSKDFITKRSLDEVIPFLNGFLKEAAQSSWNKKITAHTQEYKLQLKLLNNFPSLIAALNLDGRYLNEISETIALYLSKQQPEELQIKALMFFTTLRSHNGPLIYSVAAKKSHLNSYEENVRRILAEFCVH